MTDKNTQPRELAAIDLDKERALFQAWLKGVDPRKFTPEAYSDQHLKFKGWMARAALTRQAAPESYDATVKLLRDTVDYQAKKITELQAAPVAPTLSAAECMRALSWLAEYKQHHFLMTEDEALIAKLTGAAPEAPASEQQAKVAQQLDESWKVVIGAAAALAHLQIEDDDERELMMTHVRRIAAAIPKATTASASCDECVGSGKVGPDENPAEMDCEVCKGTGRAPAPSRDAAPLKDAVQYLQNVTNDAVPMLSCGFPKTSMLLKDAVGQVVAALAQQGAGQAAHAGADTERDAARYRVLRRHVAPREVCFSMGVPVKEIPPEQSIEERIDELCDAAMSAATEEPK